VTWVSRHSITCESIKYCGAAHRRNLANIFRGGGGEQKRPGLLRNLIYEGVQLEREGKLA
jgi:hypothetical protein